MNTNSLQHHGILGMRWGIRRNPAQLARRSPPSEDHTRSRELNKRKTNTLSNAEIRTLTERLQLEQNLKRVRPTAVNTGMAAAKTVLAAGTTVASLYALTKTPLGKDIVNAVSKRPTTLLLR